jgi:hypothetical protein
MSFPPAARLGIALLLDVARGYSRSFRFGYQSQGRTFAVAGIAILIAVDELRTNFSQVACSDPRLAHHAEGVRAGRPAVHQRKSDMAAQD